MGKGGPSHVDKGGPHRRTCPESHVGKGGPLS